MSNPQRQNLKQATNGTAGRIKIGKVICEYHAAKKSAGKGLKIVLPKKDPKQLQFIKNQLTLSAIPYTEEFRFDKKRLFRADIALPDHHILIEYEGIIRQKTAQKSRHTTITGYSKDCEKYNLAAMNGYRVFRYTALNYKDINLLINHITA